LAANSVKDVGFKTYWHIKHGFLNHLII